jgi:hypothetical protein
MDITNKTNRPLTIPLPRGKTLHLGPRKKAQITAHAAEHPPLKKLVEAGDVEVTDEADRFNEGGPSGGGGGAPLAGHGSGGGSRRSSGDR